MADEQVAQDKWVGVDLGSTEGLEARMVDLGEYIAGLEARIAGLEENARLMVGLLGALGELVNYRLTSRQIGGGKVRLDWNPTGRIVV